MEQILWHRRESRRKQRKQTWSYSHGSLLSTRNFSAVFGKANRFYLYQLEADFDVSLCIKGVALILCV